MFESLDAAATRPQRVRLTGGAIVERAHDLLPDPYGGCETDYTGCGIGRGESRA